MNITDAKTGEEAGLSATGLGEYKGVLLRALIAYLQPLNTALYDESTDAAARRTAFLACGLVDAAKYADWDAERFTSAMASLTDAALSELLRWKRETKGQLGPLSGFAGLFGGGSLEGELLRRGMGEGSDPFSELLDAPYWINRIPTACPPPLQMLGLRGLWAFMAHADNNAISTPAEAREIKFALDKAEATADKSWEEVTTDLLRVFGSCTDDSFLTWG